MPPARFWHTLLALVILAVAGAGLFYGWQHFWFLTDDAFIIFRYVSNSYLGYGYTWNLPPFRPVEGYTSFLWALLLDGAWRLTGLQPPQTANNFALFFAYITLGLGAAMVLTMRLHPALARWRWALLALVLLGTLTNRTFLAWTSSGLETAMFNCLVTAWVFVGLKGLFRFGNYMGESDSVFKTESLSSQSWERGEFLPNLKNHILLAFIAVLIGLTRPDGLLFIAATLALNCLALLAQMQAQGFRLQQLIPFSPFLITLAHFAWRRWMYGEWLPNTFAAKYVAPWLESGWRYLLSFVIEYGLWFWIGLAVVFAVVRLPQWAGKLNRAGAKGRRELNWPPLIILGTLAAHLAYYTFGIGGDHFEYRIYSHLPLLLFVSFVWLLNALLARPALALGLTALFVVGSWPIQWTHWQQAQSLETRAATLSQRVAVAPALPELVRFYGQWFDDLQNWLLDHAVCVRYHEHKLFAQHQLEVLPPRAAGLLLAPQATPVLIEGAVGVLSWVLPTTNIIDWHGLNDYVIARHPSDPNTPRVMAHDRFPPDGYTECFNANLAVAYSRFIIGQHPTDIAQVVADCERRAWPTSPFRFGRPVPNLVLNEGAARYLNNVWTPEPLYIVYAPPEQAAPPANAALVSDFTQRYPGNGCWVLPPAARYFFLFLPAGGRPGLPALQALFPWTKVVSEQFSPAPPAYHLAYAAPLGVNEVLEVQPTTPLAQTWAGLQLRGYTLRTPSVAPGGTVHLTLYFQADAPMPNYGVTIQALQNATPLGQYFGDICGGLFSTTNWEAGMQVVGQFAIPLPPDAPTGDYELQLKIFDWQTGETVQPEVGPRVTFKVEP